MKVTLSSPDLFSLKDIPDAVIKLREKVHKEHKLLRDPTWEIFFGPNKHDPLCAHVFVICHFEVE